MTTIACLSHRDVPQTALLLVAHGTRDPRGQSEVREVATQLAAAAVGRIVECAFLELAEPTIATSVARCYQRGARRLIVQPLLLFAAGHVRQDIPAAVRDAARMIPELEVSFAEHLGCSPHLLELSDLRFAQAAAADPSYRDADTLLLMVGRGSHDEQARGEMFRFSHLRQQQRKLADVQTCFLAMAQPSLAEGLAAAARRGLPRIVVQPHLLFRGDLLERLEAETVATAALHPHQQWLVARHLGPHPLLMAAVLDRLNPAAAANQESSP